MDDKSTPAGDDPKNADAAAGSTTDADPNKAADNQPADDKKGDNLDPSKSDDTTDSSDGDKPEDKKSAPEGDKKPDEDAGDGSAVDDDAPALQLDDDLDEWIEKRGLAKPESDEQRQKYQELRNEQREFTRERQAAKDAKGLKKGMEGEKPDSQDEDDDDDADPLEKDVKTLKEDLAQERITRQQSEFYVDNKVTTEEHQAILDVFKEKVNASETLEGKRRAFEFWSTPDALPDLLDLARVKMGKASADTVADEAAQKEREKIAKESNASGPGRSATKPSTSDDSPDEQRHKLQLERYS